MKTLTAQLATEVPMMQSPKYVEDDGYAVEPKLDGHRLLLVGTGDSEVVALGRSGGPYGHQIPKPLKRLRLPQGWTVDGEMVDKVLWVFDLIPDGREALTLTARRNLAAALVHYLDSPSMRLVIQARGVENKTELIRQIIETKREGFIIKRLDAPYTPGRSASWMKVKLVSTIDAVVLDVRDDGKESVRLGVYSKGKMIDVGRTSIVGKGKIAPGDVLELRYLYATDRSRPRLVQPRVMRRRTDKTATECTADQLKYTNKAVIE